MSSSLIAVLSALICVTLSAPFPGPQCPGTCKCTTFKSQPHLIKVNCQNLKFLENLSAKQVHAIVHLQVNNANLTAVDGKVKKLRALKSLDLSHNGLREFSADFSHADKLTHLHLGSNHIKHFTASNLPKHLQQLDLSQNYLTQLPQDLTKLKSLREVNLKKNPFTCTCDNKNQWDLLTAMGVSVIAPLTCQSLHFEEPRFLRDVNCTAIVFENELDGMQGDEPASEGSGQDNVDGSSTDIFDEDHTSKKLQNLDDEDLMPATSIEDGEDVEMEGSGDDEDVKKHEELEGSGDSFESVSTNDENRKACYFEPCSPIKIDEKFYENSTEKNPEVGKEIIEGIKETFGFGNEEDESKGKVTGETDESRKAEVHEDVLDRSDVIKLESGPTTEFGEKIEKATLDSASTQFQLSTNMIIVVCLIVVMICIIVYSICVKRKGHAAPRSQPMEQEMKPLKKKDAIVSSNDGNAPEKEPLMNGRNGNMNGKPVEEPVSQRRNEELQTIPPQADIDGYYVLRKGNKDQQGDLPETHRVTVQAKELSTPKTPRLVIRSKAQTGEIITTPSSNLYS